MLIIFQSIVAGGKVVPFFFKATMVSIVATAVSYRRKVIINLHNLTQVGMTRIKAASSLILNALILLMIITGFKLRLDPFARMVLAKEFRFGSSHSLLFLKRTMYISQVECRRRRSMGGMRILMLRLHSPPILLLRLQSPRQQHTVLFRNKRLWLERSYCQG